jgi:hypothetical protein
MTCPRSRHPHGNPHAKRFHADQSHVVRSSPSPGTRLGRSLEEVDMSGVSPQDLAEADLIRELAHLHRTRHDTFLHGSPDALREHNSRLAELEREYLRRHPERDVDPARTRAGARGDTSS